MGSIDIDGMDDWEPVTRQGTCAPGGVEHVTPEEFFPDLVAGGEQCFNSGLAGLLPVTSAHQLQPTDELVTGDRPHELSEANVRATQSATTGTNDSYGIHVQTQPPNMILQETAEQMRARVRAEVLAELAQEGFPRTHAGPPPMRVHEASEGRPQAGVLDCHRSSIGSAGQGWQSISEPGSHAFSWTGGSPAVGAPVSAFPQQHMWPPRQGQPIGWPMAPHVNMLPQTGKTTHRPADTSRKSGRSDMGPDIVDACMQPAAAHYTGPPAQNTPRTTIDARVMTTPSLTRVWC